MKISLWSRSRTIEKSNMFFIFKIILPTSNNSPSTIITWSFIGIVNIPIGFFLRRVIFTIYLIDICITLLLLLCTIEFVQVNYDNYCKISLLSRRLRREKSDFFVFFLSCEYTRTDSKTLHFYTIFAWKLKILVSLLSVSKT